MPKRLTDTDIWKNQRWFRKLNPLDKLAWIYIKDQCNHAGIWKIDCSDLMDDLGISEFNLPEFIKNINNEFDKFSGQTTTKLRLKIINNTYLWVTGFIQFQQENKEGKVNAEANPVKTALEILSGFNVLDEALLKGYLTLIKGKLRLPKGYINSNSNSSINTVTKTNTVTKSKTENKLAFNTMPTKADLNGLPDHYVENAIELVFRVGRITVDKDTVTGLWEVFKTQHLTGHNYYANDGKVYSHFLNTIKNLTFNYELNKRGTKTGPSEGRSRANRDY